MTSEGLKTPVQYVKGVGPHKAELFKKLDIAVVEDLIFHFPRSHQDRHIIALRQGAFGSKHAFLGEVQSAEFRQVGKNLGQFTAKLKDVNQPSAAFFDAVWFKRLSYQYDVFSSLKKAAVSPNQMVIYGELVPSQKGPVVKAEDWHVKEEPEISPTGLTPIYPLTEGIPERWLRILLQTAIPKYAPQLPDLLPEKIRLEQQLIPLSDAIREYHFPKNKLTLDKAHERLAFDEFFFLELALAMNRMVRGQSAKGQTSIPTKKLLTPFKHKLQYEFTRAQIRVINEIFRDMARSQPMNRLLQGDVGSGKTVVALSAALLAIENSRQAAFLAPTEILAQQHVLSVANLLSGLDVNVALLTGSVSKPDRSKIIAQLKTGQINLIIGTHALLTDEVEFNDLGLVIIDEQHRFGVRQRAALLEKAQRQKRDLIEKLHPDVLCMTATPIPRTLALTLYGDLDVSSLDEKPPGRASIRTSILSEENALTEIQSVVARGEQVYVVFPVIDESEKVTKRNEGLRAVIKEFEKLKSRFPQHQIGLLHGRLKAAEKKAVMDLFRQNQIHILVATPVIEVGIDVPNATLIAIFNPERFGLAALHQLRGRVGRGAKPSRCLLVSATEEFLNPSRLQLFCQIEDGFKLAEEDLRSRGPGEFLGESQHGIPFFKVANLVEDGLLLARAREAARQLVQGDIPLTMREFSALNQALQKRFGQNLHLSQVG